MPIYYPLSEQAIHHATLLGKDIRTLNYKDLLIYLCIHGASHCWEKLELIYSVAKILTSGRISSLPDVIHVRDSRMDGVKYLLRLFFQPTIREWDKYPLPDSLLSLYYILRPYRLIKEGIGKQHA